MTPGSVQRVVEELAAEQDGHPFGASYVAERAGVGLEDAYEQLEALAERHELNRHFELVSPLTGRSLRSFRLGDKLPIGATYDPDRDDDEPFVVSPENILVTFSPSAELQTRVQKKKDKGDPPSQSSRQRAQQILESSRKAVEELRRKIRSEGRRSTFMRGES